MPSEAERLRPWLYHYLAVEGADRDLDGRTGPNRAHHVQHRNRRADKMRDAARDLPAGPIDAVVDGYRIERTGPAGPIVVTGPTP